MKFCGSCGQQVEENALVCTKCGVPQKSLAPQSSEMSLGFKKPGEYEDAQKPQEQFDGIPVQSAEAPPTMSVPVTDAAMPGAEEQAVEEPADADDGSKVSSEHVCVSCRGTLIFSLARGLWYCPGCGTEAPSLPPPFADDEPEEDEAVARTQELLQPTQLQMPAGPLPDKKSEEGKAAAEKQPDIIGGITKNQATESILEIQNLIEAKAKKGMYSIDAETGFESMKLSFTQNNYPAVLQLNQQIKVILENADKELQEEQRAAAFSNEAMPPGGLREQAINALNSARNLILEAEKLNYDLTESKKIFKQAEPSFKAGDYRTASNFAHDVEESVHTVLGGKRLAIAPTVQPRYPGAPNDSDRATGSKDSFLKKHRELIFKFVLPITGLMILFAGVSLAYIAYDDGIWNPFSDGPDDWGPYNTAGVILGIVAIIVGLIFAILPFFLTKKVYVRMEPPKPIQMN